MTEPSISHAPRMRTPVAPGDARLTSPAFARNAPPIIAELSPWLRGATGAVLELGAGTGEHAAALALAFPALAWHGSDPDAIHRASIAAWAHALRAPAREPLDIDAAADWAGDPAVRALGPLTAVYAGNVIHIAPPAVLAGILRGAGRALAVHGLLILYGPFAEYGAHTGPGNVTFDARLRADNPDWGLRDIAEIDKLADRSGLARAGLITMPANNRLLIYRKRRD